MVRLNADPGDRLKSGIAVAAVHLVLGLVLLRSFGFTVPTKATDETQLIRIDLDDPPPPPTPAPPGTERQPREVARPKNPEGAASPANRKNDPAAVVAPIPVIPLPVPQVPTAPIAGSGSAPAAGAAVLAGPGTGAGGVGTGLGSGRFGNGTGGGGGGLGVHAKLLRGGIGPNDYPRRAVQRRAQGTTYIRFTVWPDGRVRNCVVTRTSGHRDLDVATCRLLERNLRFRPARDAAGRPVAEVVRGQQDWELGPEPPAREYDGEFVDD
ncbi:energy transducer TonB [Sphingomonas piscis]|uniref:Energy transducer TonB n=1 Tax=Sphingomonas piscis TaxID=2714943 RepID=A0A6G7YRL2_9SPHN|nr:energy transducer TonB [Sphingomonas piscis]QIK79376.1 energy transducer TonB [Sphingomonas piscis]